MLRSLKINNIALIDECHIQFDSGFNVLTGETGAGKSIIIDSINFVLGSRSDKSLIKHGKETARVEAVFDIDEDTRPIFEEMGLEWESVLIVTRVFSINGKSECRINGNIATLGMLKKITSHIVDVFGQNDHAILLDENAHLDMLDQFASPDLNKKKEQLIVLLDKLNQTNHTIKSIGGLGADRERNKDILIYQIDEIENAALKENEDEDLQNRKNLLVNAEKISNTLNEVLNLLDGDFGITSNLKISSTLLASLEKYTQSFSLLSERLGSVKYEVEDVYETLRDEYNSLDFSQRELDEIEARLDLINNLKRKYGKTLSDIDDFLCNAKEKLDFINNAEEKLIELLTVKEKVLDDIFAVANDITRLRKDGALVFENKIEKELKELGMKNARFVVSFGEAYLRQNIENLVTQNGCDKISLLFSANLGEEVKPISKIISGGEMSRFMLGFKCALNEQSHKTYIFDEIDTGIGGDSGIIVAKKMSKIAKSNQVLCVTHLAQIASFSDIGFKIEKYEADNRTYSKINPLSNEEKIVEIARMIGANDNREYALLHAKQLILEAKGIKSQL